LPLLQLLPLPCRKFMRRLDRWRLRLCRRLRRFRCSRTLLGCCRRFAAAGLQWLAGRRCLLPLDVEQDVGFLGHDLALSHLQNAFEEIISNREDGKCRG
jgi:hypothetical protein